MSDANVGPQQPFVDVVVIGGSAAGLAAALQLGRQRRSVVVVDAGEPRNAPAAHMHGYLGHDGLPPAELLELGRAEVRRYGVQVDAGVVHDVSHAGEGGFRVEVRGGRTLVARRVLAATGLVDVLPEIDGLAAHWGTDVIHCPFCHGYEVRDRRIVHLVTHPMGLHVAPMFRQLTDRYTMVVLDGAGVDDDRLALLWAAGVAVVPSSVRRIVSGADGRLAAVELADGSRLDADAVVVGPRFHARAGMLTSLGIRPVPHPSGLGDALVVDAAGATSVPGVHAAGNVTDPSQQVLHAAAHGNWVGAMLAADLAEEDLRLAVDRGGR